MKQEEIQSELDRRYEEDRQNAYLINVTVQRIISDFLKKTYGETLSKKERLMYTSSIRAIATDFLWQRWVGGKND